MRKARWLAPWKDSIDRPVIYHLLSRVVDRKCAFGEAEREHFRMLMRMYENFSGCQVLSYCIMSNHFHILLEVPPMAEGGLTDTELLKRLSATGSEVFVAGIAKELAEARERVVQGLADEAHVQGIHERFTYRMHDLSEFMKVLLQRFTRWYNSKNDRTGTLWEERYKSVIVEDGIAAKTMAAYIDLNPVRAGMVADPADYRWTSYGEAMGGGAKGNGKKARAGLVRALRAHKGYGADAQYWNQGVAKEYRMLLLEEGVEQLEEVVSESGEDQVKVKRKGIKREVAAAELEQLERGKNVAMGKMLRCRVRYFTDGAVIGSRGFVEEVFQKSRERFGPKRKDGARKWRGNGEAAAGVLWSIRDLRKGV